MNCLYFNCQGIADYPYPCCSSEHGWLHKGFIGQMKKYQDGVINWKYLWNPFDEECPSIEKCEYYANLILERSKYGIL